MIELNSMAWGIVVSLYTYDQVKLSCSVYFVFVTWLYWVTVLFTDHTKLTVLNTKKSRYTCRVSLECSSVVMHISRLEQGLREKSLNNGYLKVALRKFSLTLVLQASFPYHH